VSRQKTKKWIAIGTGVILALLIAVLLMRPASVSVETAVIQRGNLIIEVKEQGRTRARDRYTVAAPIGGQLMRPDVLVGQTVAKGDVLVRISPAPEDPRTEAAERADLVAAQAYQRETEAQLEEARGNYQRVLREANRRNELYGRQLVSIEERDRYAQSADAAKARLASVEASVAAATAQVESARSKLLGMNSGAGDEGTIDVKAPVSGQVLQIFEQSTRVIQAGTPLFELNAGNALELVIDVLTQDAVNIEPGDTIVIDEWGASQSLTGQVRYTEPQAFTKLSSLGVEEQRVNIIGDLTETPDTLGAEYRISASIITWQSDDVLLVPTAAIFRRNDQWQVYVVDQGKARLQTLELGQRGTDRAEVLNGLQEGAEVILYPSDLIEEGVSIEIVN